MSERRRTTGRGQGCRQPHRDTACVAGTVDQHAVPVGRRLEVEPNEVDEGREGRHRGALMPVAVQTKPTRVVAGKPNRRRTAMSLNAQSEEKSLIGAVTEQERSDVTLGQLSVSFGRRQTAEVERTPGQLTE